VVARGPTQASAEVQRRIVVTMRWVYRALVASTIVLAFVCSGTAATGKPLRIGMAAVYKPFVFKDDGKLQGIEVDFAERIGKDLGVEVTLVQFPWEELIPALREGKIDVIMSGMSITPERSKLVLFAEPYLQVGQMALIRRDDAIRFHDTATMNLPTTTIGVHRGTTGEKYVRQTLPRAKMKTYDSVDAGIAALRAKEIDVFIHDAPTIWRVRGREQDQYPDLMGRYHLLTTEDLAWAVRKDDQALRNKLDRLLSDWEDSGWLESVLDRWIPVRKVTIETKSPARGQTR
jgi:ABC-type amino acid transport substrate-binding protein